MKLKSLLFLLFSLNMLAQNPTIEGNLMLCPDTNGTASITNNQTYDTYQWYSKYWFTNDPYVEIPNATSATFTYDWYTYDQSLLKVVVTSNGTTYESNAIQIDSYNWTPLYITNELNEFVTIDSFNGNLLVCAGHTVDLNLPGLFSENIVWSKNGVAIEGANSLTYTVTEPGSYTAKASPNICPGSSNTTNDQPVVVEFVDCSLSNPSHEFEQNIQVYPNPTTEILQIEKRMNSDLNYTVHDLNQREVVKGILNQASSTIDMSKFSTGVYLVTLSNGQHTKTYKIIKK